jgi:hypothetical protein
MTIDNAIPKFIALLLISIGFSLLAINIDNTFLAKVDSMSNADFIAYERGLHHHSFLHHFVLVVIAGGLFIASLEFVAYVIGLCFKKKPAS